MRDRLLLALGSWYARPCSPALQTCRRVNTCRRYASQRQWSTPLAKTLNDAITTTGPISVASYMRQCLTSDLGGYYTADSKPDRDQFGRKGDFVTSPEISQIFGELIGLWVVAEWMAQGSRSSGVYLMEVGPGRGTLMSDMLRTFRNFPKFTAALDGVYLIEASASLRQAQHKLLCGDAALEQTDTGHKSKSALLSGLAVHWADDIRLCPQDIGETPFIIAHEFFDALPIHCFRSVPPGKTDTIETPTGPIQNQKQSARVNAWRELLVTPTPINATHTTLGTPKSLQSQPVADFQLVMAPASTPHSVYLPEQSPRYRALKSTTDAVIEISPESRSYAAEFAVRIGGGTDQSAAKASRAPPAPKGTVQVTPKNSQFKQPQPKKGESSGAALIIDYGPSSTIPSNSLRGIKSHKLVSPFAEPGRVDISADVDFVGLAESAIDASKGVEVHGPVDQARFLEAMGIQQRAAQLVKKALESQRTRTASSHGEARPNLAEMAKRIDSGRKRLVDRGPQGMGKLYKVMAIVPHRAGSNVQSPRRPVGFGGDVSA